MTNTRSLTRNVSGAAALGIALFLGGSECSAQVAPTAAPTPAAIPLGPALPVPRLIADPPAPSATTATFADGWTMHIIPAQPAAPTYQGRTYDQIYESIPYRKSEHLANPSYRHDATMEILFGELRPTVIHREQAAAFPPPMPPAPVYPWRPYLLGNGSLWNYSPPVLRYITPYLPMP